MIYVYIYIYVHAYIYIYTYMYIQALNGPPPAEQSEASANAFAAITAAGSIVTWGDPEAGGDCNEAARQSPGSPLFEALFESYLKDVCKLSIYVYI